MLNAIILYGLDAWGFAAVGLAATIGLHLWLRRRERRGLGVMVHVSAVAVIAVGMTAAALAGQNERDRLRDQLLGFAPTYAAELELMDHARVDESTARDDPAYAKMIAAEIRWLRVNPAVADIYTFRKERDGKIHLIVDSETDYDHNGKYEGDRESRTTIGEAYDGALPGWFAALTGVASFDEQPQTDRWGTWISAYVPIRDSAGRVEAAVGVDYDAGKWATAIEWHRSAALGLAGVVLTIILSAASVITIGRAELAQRERLQRQLVDASRQAGMAEVAIGVLHNVGNVLNNVTVSAEVVADQVRNSRVAGVARAAGLMREHDADLAAFLTQDDRGRLLPDYLAELSDALNAEQAGVIEELSALNRSLSHVRQIVASQQTFAKNVHVIETFAVAEVIDEAVRLGVTAEQRGNVAIDFGEIDVVPLNTDRHEVLQILTNLLSNAAKATLGGATRRIKVTAAADVLSAAPAVRVSVRDSGCGMTAETIAKLFTHGFTTRPDGHGFGLHHSAIAAANLGGTLVAHSDGPGRGATFTLTVPIEAPASVLADHDAPG